MRTYRNKQGKATILPPPVNVIETPERMFVAEIIVTFVLAANMATRENWYLTGVCLFLLVGIVIISALHSYDLM